MHPYQDLKEAIANQALKYRRDGAVIIASEHTGEYAEWIFDLRAVLLQPQWLNRFAEIFWEKYASQYPFQVGGMEMAGVPLVAAIVMKGVERGTPVNGFFIRKSRKREGLTKAIEGTLNDTPVILVDDLINSGNTFNKQIAVLAEAGKKVSDICVIVSFRDMSVYSFASGQGVHLQSLFTLQDFGLAYVPAGKDTPQKSFFVRWRFSAPKPSFHLVAQKSAPVLDTERIFFGSDNGVFYALNQKTGDVMWHMSVGLHPKGKGILSSPTLRDGILYVGAYDGNIYALDAATGKKKWVNSDADWIGSSPALAPALNSLFVGLEFGLMGKAGGIAAIAMDTGTTKWQHHTSDLTHGSPLYIEEENLVVIGSNDGIVYAYDAKTGVLRWKYLAGGDIRASFAYDKKRRLVLFGSMDTKLYVLSAQDGVPLFAYQTGAGIYSTPLVFQDTVYIASLDKNIYAIELGTWKTRWIFTTRGRIFASPALFEGSLWIGSNDGRMYEFNPESGKLLNLFQFSERIVNKIAYNPATKQFFVPTQANEIYCVERNIKT